MIELYIRSDLMFKIAKLDQVDHENVNIYLITQEQCKFENGKKISCESFKTLGFDIDGKINNDEYNFSFELNCRLEELLKFPNSEIVDFNKYIWNGETWLNVNGLNGVEPQMDIKITRYLKNKFIIFLTFYTDYSYDDNSYSGMIEITFDLDNYLENSTKI